MTRNKLCVKSCTNGMKQRIQFGCTCACLLLVLVIGPNGIYLFNEFITNNHHTDHDAVYTSWSQLENEVPKVIHQVMFNTTIPQRFLDARKKCQQVNRGLSFILWNKTMVDQLVEDHYPFIHDLFHSYNVWVKRADVARYLIVHYYGGIYIDMDTDCRGR